MSGHTPGPWRANTSNQGSAVVADTPRAVKVIARTPRPSMSREQAADARLIAAAPELLAVARYARAVLPDEAWADDTKQMLDAAIANATGEQP